MLGSFYANNAKRIAHPLIGRRCHAAWLLVGWLAFWLTTAAQPFEHRFGGEPDHRSAVSSPTSGSVVSHLEHAPDPAPDNSHCPDVSAVTVAVAPATTVTGDRLDPVYPSFDSPVPVAQRDGDIRNLKTYFPPPWATTPLYLRTQRLRI